MDILLLIFFKCSYTSDLCRQKVKNFFIKLLFMMATFSFQNALAHLCDQRTESPKLFRSQIFVNLIHSDEISADEFGGFSRISFAETKKIRCLASGSEIPSSETRNSVARERCWNRTASIRYSSASEEQSHLEIFQVIKSFFVVLACH